MTATLAQARDAIVDRLRSVAGLDNVYGYYNGSPTPPCAIVGWPERLSVGQRMGNPAPWEAVIPVQILVTMGDSKNADAVLARFCDPEGSASVQAVFDDDPTLSGVVAEAVVTFFDNFGVAQFAEQGVQYLSCVANVNVIAD